MYKTFNSLKLYFVQLFDSDVFNKLFSNTIIVLYLLSGRKTYINGFCLNSCVLYSKSTWGFVFRFFFSHILLIHTKIIRADEVLKTSVNRLAFSSTASWIDIHHGEAVSFFSATTSKPANWKRVNQSERYKRTRDCDLFLKWTINIEEYEHLHLNKIANPAKCVRSVCEPLRNVCHLLIGTFNPRFCTLCSGFSLGILKWISS